MTADEISDLHDKLNELTLDFNVFKTEITTKVRIYAGFFIFVAVI